jgi:hypothetical protein
VRRCIAQRVLYLREHHTRVVQSPEQRPGAASLRRGAHLLLPRNRASTLSQSIDAEDFAADRSYKVSTTRSILIRACPGKKALEEILFSFRWSSSGHVAKVKGAAEASPFNQTKARSARDTSRDPLVPIYCR